MFNVISFFPDTVFSILIIPSTTYTLPFTHLSCILFYPFTTHSISVFISLFPHTLSSYPLSSIDLILFHYHPHLHPLVSLHCPFTPFSYSSLSFFIPVLLGISFPSSSSPSSMSLYPHLYSRLSLHYIQNYLREKEESEGGRKKRLVINTERRMRLEVSYLRQEVCVLSFLPNINTESVEFSLHVCF